MKANRLKKISVIIAAAIVLPQTAFVSAVENPVAASVYYENHFDTAADMAMFSGEGSTFTVENGMGKIVTNKPSSTSARQVFAAFDTVKPLHKVARDAIDTLEVKVKFEEPTIKFLFGTRDRSGETEQSNSTLLKFSTATGNLRGADDTSFSQKMPAGEWQQLYFVFNNDKYDLYINGKKANEASISLGGKQSLTISQIDKLLFQGSTSDKTKVDQTTWVDDFISQKLVPIYLTGSTVENAATNVSIDTQQITLDFNTIVDPASLSFLKIKAGTREIGNTEYAVTVDENDATKAVVSFNGTLTGNTQYTIDYSGIKDVINAKPSNTANGTIGFTTEAKEMPFAITSMEPQTNVGLNSPITITFNKAVSTENLNSQITVSDNTEVTVLVNGNTVVVTPMYHWLANKQYTVSCGSLTAIGGTVISQNENSTSFSTIADPYAAAAKTGDYSWYNGGADKSGKVNAQKAQEMGVCGVSYNGVKPIVQLEGQTDLPFIYRSSMGSGDDTLTGNMVYMSTKNNSSAAIVYEAENGLGAFKLTTGEKTYNPSGGISLYTAPEGADFTDDSVYKKAEFTRSQDVLTDKWNGNITYTLTANDPKIKYIKVVITKPEGTSDSSIYSPVLRQAEIVPYAPQMNIYNAVSTGPKTLDVTFDGLLDQSSVNPSCFAVSDNTVESAAVVIGDNIYRQTVRLTLTNELSQNSAVTVRATGVRDIYGNIVSDKSYVIAATDQTICFENVAEANGTVTGTIKLPSGNEYKDKTANIIVSYYEDGFLSDVEIAGITLKEGENKFRVTFDGFEKNTETNNHMKVMLWTSLEEITPICGVCDIVDNTQQS